MSVLPPPLVRLHRMNHKKALPTIDRGYYWRRSLTTAVLATRLADQLAPNMTEEAFITGLLADVGVVVLDEALPDEYRPIAEEYRTHGKVDLACDERSILGITHGEASAAVLEHWQLPEVICEAVGGHPWETTDQETYAPARLVGAADRISKYLCESPKELDTVVADCRSLLDVLGLEPAVLADLIEDIESHIAEFAKVLRVDVALSKVYQLIADALRDSVVASEPSPT